MPYIDNSTICTLDQIRVFPPRLYIDKVLFVPFDQSHVFLPRPLIDKVLFVPSIKLVYNPNIDDAISLTYLWEGGFASLGEGKGGLRRLLDRSRPRRHSRALPSVLAAGERTERKRGGLERRHRARRRLWPVSARWSGTFTWLCAATTHGPPHDGVTTYQRLDTGCTSRLTL